MAHLVAFKACSNLFPALATVLFTADFALRKAIVVVIPFRPFVVIVVVPVPSNSLPLLLVVASPIPPS